MSESDWSDVIGTRFKNLDPVSWSALKLALPIGTSVTGLVIAKAPFGAWLDIGHGFPAMVPIPSVAGLTPEKYRADNWCPIGSVQSGIVVGLVDQNMQVRISQI